MKEENQGPGGWEQASDGEQVTDGEQVIGASEKSGSKGLERR